MENTCPMDRLICGDVGFGKTEIAIRAAFKAAVDACFRILRPEVCGNALGADARLR